MKRARPSAQSRQPVVPGQRCPAIRNNKHDDPKVTITSTASGVRHGERECAMCGRRVSVEQGHGMSNDDPWTAWYYEQHDVPIAGGILPKRNS